MPCAEKHLWCALDLVTWKKKEKEEQPWGGFHLAWKSGINSNVSTLWSKEAPRKSSVWSTSQSWSWDLQNQPELNEFARTVLEGVEQGMLRSAGSSWGTACSRAPVGLAAAKAKILHTRKPETLRAPLWGVPDVLLWAHLGPAQLRVIPIHHKETKTPVLQVVGRSSNISLLISHWKTICLYLPANQATQLSGAILAEKAGEQTV